MCGIAGLLSPDANETGPRTLAAMTRVLRHRGPDDEGFASIDPVTGRSGFGSTEPPAAAPILFGHRRLSIIDLSIDGRQPMGLPDAPHWITYNGEIYNYVELRDGLREYQFRSQSDTEVILRAWQKWGPAALPRLNGMFAFALWDGRDVYLARDRMGVKPLYYLVRDGRLYFASEIKAFAFGAGLPLEIEPHAVAEYFTFQNIFAERSFFKDVRLLEPGHYCRIPVPFAGQIEMKEFWRPRFEEEAAEGEREAAARLRDHLDRAIAIQLRSDVEVGSYLSGGLDTSTIVALARHPGMHTFTCGYEMDGVGAEEGQFDESALSARIAGHFGTVHHPEVLAPADLPALIEKTMYHLEEPRVGISFQNYYICSKIAERVKVVLSGTGGDELFGGYIWRYLRVLANQDPFDDFYCREWTRLTPDGKKSGFFSPEIMNQIRGFRARDSYDAVLAGGAPTSPLPRALYFDQRTFLAGLLIVEDHLSMAHSLESRVPLLDDHVVDYALALPTELKVRPSEGSLVGKRILRGSMEGLLPAEVLNAPKQGFIPPMGHWFRTHLSSYLREMLERGTTAAYFAPGVVSRYLDEHLSGRVNHRAMLWSFLSFELMNRIFVERRAG